MNITISATAATADAAAAFAADLHQILSIAPDGITVTAATLTNDDGSTVDLLATAPVAPTLDEAVAELDDAIAAVSAATPAEDGSITLTADEAAALVKAAEDVATAEIPCDEPQPAPGTPVPDAPVTDAAGAAVAL